MRKNYLWVRDIIVKTQKETFEISLEVSNRDETTTLRRNDTPVDAIYDSEEEAISNAIQLLKLAGESVDLTILLNNKLISPEDVRDLFKEKGVNVASLSTY